MSGAVVGVGTPRRGVSVVDRRAEDRWVGTPVRNASLAMSGVVLASLVIHAGLLVFAATFGDRAPPPRQQETTVELVQESIPKPTSEPAASKPPEAGGPEVAKAGEAADKVEAIRPEPPKVELPKAPPQRDQAQPDQAQPDQAKAAQPKAPRPVSPVVDPARVEPAQPEPPTTADRPAEEARIADKEAALQSLKQELESLKAEQETLRAEDAQAATAASTKASDAMAADGIGTIPPSFGAVQLPALSEIDGEATSYQEVVFSQLAKTKGIRRHMGMAGTAGLVFTIDESGRLLHATIAHPSGSASLDDEAMRIVTASAPFPKPPPGAPRTISANFNFVPQPAP